MLKAAPVSKASRTRPILKWAGGKSSLYEQLYPHFPDHFVRYFEPFFGGGAVFFSLNFSGESHLSDANSELVDLYNVVRQQPIPLMAELDRLAQLYSEEFYYQLRAANPDSKLEAAARTLFLNKTGFNGLYRQNAKGQFNVPFGKRTKCPALYDAANMHRVSASLQNTQLTNCDFEKLIEKAGPGDFVYCDPPYEPLSRTSSFNSYQGGGFTQSDQVRLKLSCVRAHQKGATVVISNSSAEFIRSLYADCPVYEIQARRAINSKGSSRGKIAEVAVVLSH